MKLAWFRCERFEKVLYLKMGLSSYLDLFKNVIDGLMGISSP